MKKVLFALALAIMSVGYASAQEIKQEIYKMSEEVAQDKSKSLEVRKVAQFKVDAITYMNTKMLEKITSTSKDSLDYVAMVTEEDNQAIALYNFVHIYVTKIGRATKTKERERILALFKRVSLANPRFYDEDQELVLAYCKGDRYITQFSLDTDWVKALAEVKKELGMD
ncbi:MAG: hypothetical protein IKX22_10275 [Prevotella sp.]|nr:hypothetical protein [Prevotella sp.]